MKTKIELEKQHEIIQRWMADNFKDKEGINRFWNMKAMCRPLIQENRYLKTDESMKIKVEGVTFRYKETQGQAQTRTYQVLYKLLKH